MDPVRNPYAPGAGTPPPELAGRQDVLDQARIAVQRMIHGNPTQSLILVGLRGVGKTVLLVRIRQEANEFGAQTLFIEAHEGKSLPELIIPSLRKLLLKLSEVEQAKQLARQGMRVLLSFVNSVKVKFGDIDLGITIEPATGSADSGDLESDLPELFLAIGEAAAASNQAIIFFVDELQYLSKEEFSALIMALHQTSQRQLPVMMIGAGLPQILALAGTSKSYAERLFKYPEVGALTHEDAIYALKNPAEREHVTFNAAALEKVLEETKRYPYFLQQWAHDAWNMAMNEEILEQDVVRATDAAIKALDEGFFKVRFDRCTPSERRYMRALASYGEGPHRSGDVAESLGVKVSSVAPTRSSLIKKGMVYSPAHGDTAFTVPLFHEYMIRVMPDANL